MKRREFIKYFFERGITDGNKVIIKIGDILRLADKLGIENDNKSDLDLEIKDINDL